MSLQQQQQQCQLLRWLVGSNSCRCQMLPTSLTWQQQRLRLAYSLMAAAAASPEEAAGAAAVQAHPEHVSVGVVVVLLLLTAQAYNGSWGASHPLLNV